MLMTEKQLRSIIQRLIIEGSESEATEEADRLEIALGDLPEFPMGMISKIDQAVDKDLENMDTGHAGDEGLSLLAGALLSAPIILKCIKWLAKAIGAVLSGGGFLFDYEDNAIIHVFERLEELTHDLYSIVFEAIGAGIYKLVTGEELSEAGRKKAGKIVHFVVLVAVGIWGFTGLLHAMHHHQLWLECGETIVGCIGYGEGTYLMIAIAEFLQGKDITVKEAAEKKEELGLPDAPLGSMSLA